MPSSADRHHSATGASLIAIILVVVCFVGVMLLHALRTDVSPLEQVMSTYANGSHGRIMSVVFYAFGLSSIVLAFRLSQAIVRSGVPGWFPLLMVLAGVSLVASGVFEVDRSLVPHTLQESIHSNSAVAAFVLLIVAMLLFSMACRDDPRWWRFRWTSATLAIAAAAAAVGTQLSKGRNWSGAVQRALAFSVLLWFLLTALHVRRKSFGAT